MMTSITLTVTLILCLVIIFYNRSDKYKKIIINRSGKCEVENTENNNSPEDQLRKQIEEQRNEYIKNRLREIKSKRNPPPKISYPDDESFDNDNVERLTKFMLSIRKNSVNMVGLSDERMRYAANHTVLRMREIDPERYYDRENNIFQNLGPETMNDHEFMKKYGNEGGENAHQ